MWRVALSLATVGTSPGVRAGRQLIAKIEMAVRCRGVGRGEVGVKCDCMQGCCECARTGMRVWWCVMQVAVSTKTNRFGAATRQS